MHGLPHNTPPPDVASERTFPIVGIGASAGGLAANATYLAPGHREPQGASRGFLARKRRQSSPAASALPLRVSGIGLTAFEAFFSGLSADCDPGMAFIIPTTLNGAAGTR